MPHIIIKDGVNFEVTTQYKQYLLKCEKFEITFSKIPHLSININPKDDVGIELIFHADDIEVVLDFKINMLSDVMVLFNKLLELLNQN